MYRLSDNYYHRKCYFEREQVPTQSVMKDRMGVSLANVYFKSMSYKLKILAGLEPPMQGGGTEWYMPPNELLSGRAVLKPEKKEVLNKLGFNGIDYFGEKLRQRHYMAMLREKKQVLQDSDYMWKQNILARNRQLYEDISKEEAQKNTKKILDCVHEFELMYRTSITKIEELMHDAAIKEINRVREDSFQCMKQRYADLLQDQAVNLYEEYEEKLMTEKARLKDKFIRDVEEVRTKMCNTLHDINYDKHMVIEKLRHLLQCQTLASQIYVALKEKEECKKEMELSTHVHKKKVAELKEEIAVKNFEIRLELEQQLKRQEFNRIWRKKICHVVKKFQTFVDYCLKALPEHVEFFLNMEKLMMLQVNEASENPSAESIIETESGFKTPVARPHPFYLFCDKGFKPNVDQKLCPEHRTASAEQMPVVVINKRFLYSACDNFEMFADKVRNYLNGIRGEDADFEDDHKYHLDVPLKITSETRLEDLKLESSLMQVLQQELPNIREMPIECSICKIPYCFCSPFHMSLISLPAPYAPIKKKIEEKMDMGNVIDSRSAELKLQREPKWESYMEYVEPKKCKCAKTAKKHLAEHLPAYMRITSPFEPAEIPNYEICDISKLRKMVKKARGICTPPPALPKEESKTKNVCTQYSDNDFDYLCTCFSDEQIEKLFSALIKGSKMFDTKMTQTQAEVVTASGSPSFMNKTASSFATQRAYSLRNLLDETPELEELFRRSNCDL